MANKLIIAALIALLVTFGCVGGSQTTDNASAGTTHTTAGAGNNAAANTGTNGATAGSNAAGTGNSGSSGSGQPSGGSAATSLESILANVGQADYKVTYDVISSYSGSEISMSMVQYVKGSKMRYDTKTSGFETETFILDSKSYSCTNMGQGFTCYESADAEDGSAPTGNDVASDTDNYNILPLPDRTIAGIAAKCFNMKIKSGSATGMMDNVDYCFSSDGIILYTGSSVSGGQTAMTATSVERGISDSVFTLPATPTAQ
jgi:hypothetical protein